jgi:uncharacterized protein (UPF0335 family)
MTNEQALREMIERIERVGWELARTTGALAELAAKARDLATRPDHVA